MTRRILKFTVKPFGETLVDTADDPLWLSVGTQGDDVVVWAEATVGSGVRTSLLGLFTGDDAPGPDAGYVGTTQLEGPIVVHVYRAKSL